MLGELAGQLVNFPLPKEDGAPCISPNKALTH